MHKKHGGYYYVKGGKWLGLGRILPAACVSLSSIINGTGIILPPKRGERDWLSASLMVIISNSRGRAKKLGMDHSLTLDQLQAIAASQGYCCSVTGLLFSNEKIGHANSRPYFPSLDRKDSSKGYTPDNCRLVSIAANYAMNAWGEDVFTKIATAHIRKNRKTLRPAS